MLNLKLPKKNSKNKPFSPLFYNCYAKKYCLYAYLVTLVLTFLEMCATMEVVWKNRGSDSTRGPFNNRIIPDTIHFVSVNYTKSTDSHVRMRGWRFATDPIHLG